MPANNDSRTRLPHARRIVCYPDRVVYVGFNEPQFLDAIRRRLPKDASFYNPYEGTLTIVGDGDTRFRARNLVSELYTEADDWNEEHSLARVEYLSVTVDPAPTRRLRKAWAAFVGSITRTAKGGK